MSKQVSEHPVVKNRVLSSDEGARSRADVWPLIIIASFMIATYLTSNLMAVKVIGVYGAGTVDAGTITFPIAFFLGDVLTEIWGYKTARKVIFLTFACNVFLVGFTWMAVSIPTPDYMAEMSDAYAMVFGYVPRIVAGSLVAFLTGELINAYLMVKIKEKTGRRWLALRTIGSSVLGYLVDSTIFCIIAFGGTVSTHDLIVMIAVLYLVKVLIEAILGTPFAYMLVAYLRKRIGD